MLTRCLLHRIRTNSGRGSSTWSITWAVWILVSLLLLVIRSALMPISIDISSSVTSSSIPNMMPRLDWLTLVALQKGSVISTAWPTMYFISLSLCFSSRLMHVTRMQRLTLVTVGFLLIASSICCIALHELTCVMSNSFPMMYREDSLSSSSSFGLTPSSILASFGSTSDPSPWLLPYSPDCESISTSSALLLLVNGADFHSLFPVDSLEGAATTMLVCGFS